MILWEAFLAIIVFPALALEGITILLKLCAALTWLTTPSAHRSQGFWATLWTA